MFFQELNNGQCKSYLVADIEAGVAAIIDPVESNIDRYLAMLAYHRLTLEFVADTHTHADHRSACTALRRLTGAKVLMHERSPQPNVDGRLNDGDEISVGNVSIKVLETPGHTPDSLSFYINNDRVLTGDVILIQGTGRADFAGGDAGAQYDSITEKLFTLSDETLVFPGHDYRGNTESTIGVEKKSNPRIAGKTRKEYIEIMDNLNLPLPERIQEVLQINQSEVDDDRIKFPMVAELNQVLQMEPAAVREKIDSDAVIIDVREKSEYYGELGHLKGSRLIPLSDIALSLDELEQDRDKEIILVCRSGARSTTAAAILKGLGFEKVKNLKGGMLDWHKQGFPVEK
ncbi:MAG: MBL fold metallo-hydrolase [Piscirickettsiaceae bacterium]|nr:MAG: MBL fold metallo-hydrolase [Piscirickettsiaceae bacterium]PCI70880.1 MAG: MBL fold metallo-hydrolase [Piscirickettsiaceae bacterium]